MAEAYVTQVGAIIEITPTVTLVPDLDWAIWCDWTRSDVYVDEATYLISMSGSMRVMRPGATMSGGMGVVDQCTITLDNSTGRFSPFNEAGALYSSIQDGGAYQVPVVVTVATSPGASHERVFVGQMKIPTEEGLTTKIEPTVTFQCASRDDLLLQQRLTNTRANFATIYDDAYSEEEIIIEWLEAGGMVDGTDFVSQAYAVANPTYTATLDPGLFIIPWAWLSDESPLEDSWLLAQACGGALYFSPDDIVVAPASPTGSFIYENMGNWALTTSSVETLDKDDFTALTPVFLDRELYDKVVVQTAPRDILDEGTLWELDAPITIPSSTSRVVVATLSRPLYAISSVDHTAIDSGGTNISDQVTLSYTAYSQRVDITLNNTNPTKAAIVAVLEVVGQDVAGGQSLEITEETSLTGASQFWETRSGRTKYLRNNPYIQTYGHAKGVAEWTLSRSELPQLFFRLDNIFPGRPGRRVTDRVTVSDSDVLTTNREGFIIGIDWRLDRRTGFVQNYTIVDAETLFEYLQPFDSDGYFTLGVSKWGDSGTSSVPGRTFF